MTYALYLVLLTIACNVPVYLMLRSSFHYSHPELVAPRAPSVYDVPHLNIDWRGLA